MKKYKDREEEKSFTQVKIVSSPPKGPVLFAEENGIKLYREVSAEYLKALAAGSAGGTGR